MGLQCERYGDMIPQGYRMGSESTLEPIGCDHMSMGKPMNPQLPFVLYPQSLISSRSWMRQLIPWAEEGMAVLFRD